MNVKTNKGTTYKLSRYEMETVIIFNAEEQDALICTCEPAQILRYKNLCAEQPELYKEERTDGRYFEFVCTDKKLFYPRKKKQLNLTEEQRTALSERAKNLHKAKQA